MKLNEFMLNTFIRTRDIIMDLWPHWLVNGFLNCRLRIESWQQHWSSSVMLSTFFNFGGFFSLIFKIFFLIL